MTNAKAELFPNLANLLRDFSHGTAARNSPTASFLEEQGLAYPVHATGGADDARTNVGKPGSQQALHGAVLIRSVPWSTGKKRPRQGGDCSKRRTSAGDGIGDNDAMASRNTRQHFAQRDGQPAAFLLMPRARPLFLRSSARITELPNQRYFVFTGAPAEDHAHPKPLLFRSHRYGLCPWS